MKKHLFLTLVCLIVATISMMATDYCGDTYTLSYGGQSKDWKLHFWKEGGLYKFEVQCITTPITSVNSSQYGSVGGTWVSLDGGLSVLNNTLYGSFNGAVSGSGGSQLNISLNSSSLTFPMPTDINWDANCGPKTMYFVNSWGWEDPCVYMWKSSDESQKNGDWPGEHIKTTFTQISTTCSGAPVYKIEYDAKYDKVIFSDNGVDDKKTQNLDINADRFYNPHPEDGEGISDEWYYSKNLFLYGSFNSWNNSANPFSEWTGSSTVVSTTIHLTAGDYEFKIYQSDAARSYGNGGTITENVSCWFMNPNEDNCKLTVTGAGDYTFNYDFAANRLSLSYPQKEPQMLSAEATDIRQQEATVSFVSRDDKTTTADMRYYVHVQSTTGYETEWDLRLTGNASGKYTLYGLVPGTGYRVTVYCEDEDHYLSTADINDEQYKQKVFEFTTSNGGGCSWSSGESTVAVEGGPAWVKLPEGMTYVLRVSKADDTHIAIEIDINYNPVTVSLGLCLLERWDNGLLEAYLTEDRTAYVTHFEDTEGHRYIRAVVDKDLKDPNFKKFWGESSEGWTDDNNFAVKIEWGYIGTTTGGPSAAGYYIINPQNIVDGTDCKGSFIITQSGRTPAAFELPEANGDGTITFDDQILYYRQFTPGQWEPITFPFEVASVEVYDPDDNSMFALTPKTKTANGYYLLRQQQTNVSGEDFLESWYDGTTTLPQKNTPYNIYFPEQGGWSAFYTKKYVLFRGTNGSQTVAGSFVKGTAPTGDDQYTLYGNNTLSPISNLTAYFETSDGKFYEKEESRTLQPFECYVLASTNTMARMPRIAPWPKNTATGVEETWAETDFLRSAAVYNALGQLMYADHDCIFYDVMQRCASLPSGCYVIITDLGNRKIIIP